MLAVLNLVILAGALLAAASVWPSIATAVTQVQTFVLAASISVENATTSVLAASADAHAMATTVLAIAKQLCEEGIAAACV